MPLTHQTSAPLFQFTFSKRKGLRNQIKPKPALEVTVAAANPLPPVPREANGHFQKGYSGYPGGVWAKGSIKQALARRLREGDAELIADQTLEVAKGRVKKARVADQLNAAFGILEHMEGKAVQKHQVTTLNLTPETIERVAALAERFAAQLPSPAGQILTGEILEGE